jgi:hypothetical protein
MGFEPDTAISSGTDGWVVFPSSAPGPARRRARALSPDQVERARELQAAGKSLRAISVIIGASTHESLRQALHESITSMTAD